VEFEGTLGDASLKECLWSMERDSQSQEGENNEASRSHTRRQKRLFTQLQTAPCQTVMLNL